MHKLDNSWTLWLHLLYDSDWTINSYKKVYSFDTLENGTVLIENLNKEIVEKCMLFIMKNNIKPIWEDDNNNKGGCISYKISINNVYSVWKKLVYRLIGNTITHDTELLKCLNGVSISPKKNYCIIKIWLSSIDDLSNNIIYEFLMESINTTKENSIIDITKNIVDPLNIDQLCNIEKHQCVFKKHDALY